MTARRWINLWRSAHHEPVRRTQAPQCLSYRHRLHGAVVAGAASRRCGGAHPGAAGVGRQAGPVPAHHRLSLRPVLRLGL